MSNQIGASGLRYGGVKAVQPRDWHYFPRDPNQYDNGPEYRVGDEAQNTITKTIWQLVSLAGNATSAGALADWVMVTNGGGTVISLTGDTGGLIMPLAGNINVIGDGSTIIIDGTPSTHTLEASVFGGSAGQVLLGQGSSDIASWVTPTAGAGLTLVSNATTLEYALTGTVGTITSVQTANATPQFVLTGTTETVDFGISNLVLGSTLPSLTSGTNNVGVGYHALNAITSGYDNTSIGGYSSLLLTTGFRNVAIGDSSLGNLTAGSYNICIGSYNGNGYTGSESDNIIMGQGVVGTAGESGAIRIGNKAVVSSAYMAGIYGVTPGGTNQFVTVNSATGQLGSTTGGGGGGPSASLLGTQMSLNGAFPYTSWSAPFTGNTLTNQNTAQYSMPVGGIINNAYVNVGVNNSTIDVTITLNKNGSNTPLVITIPALTTGTFSDLIHSVSVVTGDKIQFEYSTISAGIGLLLNGTVSAEFSTSGGGGSTGALVLIQTKTASGVAELDFTTGITSTYNNYMLQLSNIVWSNSSASVTLGIQISTNGGSTYISTGYHKGNASSTATNIEITEFGVGGNTIFTNSKVELSNLTSGSGYVMGTVADSLSWVPATGSAPGSAFGGLYTASSSITVNAVRVVVSDGSNFSGTGSLYGYAM
jgi:hypothetical protein